VGKGPNTVISMLDYYLRTHVPAGVSLILYCDNCPGQNKNRDLTAYLTYLVKIEKLFPEIQLYFMIAGHTKFSPDGNFGNIKTCLMKGNHFSILDLTGPNGVVQRSAKNNVEVTYKDPITGQINFRWRNWQKFFKTKFTSCNGIQKWHVIKINQESQDILVADHLGDTLRPQKIMNNKPLVGTPDILEPEGFISNRLEELIFFNDYVTADHYTHISSAY